MVGHGLRGGGSLCEDRHIFEKAFLLILYKEIANFQFTKDRAVEKRSCLPLSTPARGVVIWHSVGWAVYFVNGRLAMPLVRINRVFPTLFLFLMGLPLREQVVRLIILL